MVLFGNSRPGSEEKCYQTAFSIYRDLIEDMRYEKGKRWKGLQPSSTTPGASGPYLRRRTQTMNLARSCSTVCGTSSVRTGGSVIVRDLRELREMPLVVSAANAAEPFIGPEHLRRDAVVLDIAVPMNTRPETEQQRPDVLVIQGVISKPLRGRGCRSQGHSSQTWDGIRVHGRDDAPRACRHGNSLLVRGHSERTGEKDR